MCHEISVTRFITRGGKTCDIPGICPNISASPPSVSLSNLILVGRKEELSMKKSFLIPSVGGGIKTPKSFKTNQNLRLKALKGLLDQYKDITEQINTNLLS